MSIDFRGRDLPYPVHHGDWIRFMASQHGLSYPKAGEGYLLNPMLIDPDRHERYLKGDSYNWPDEWYWGFVLIPPPGKLFSKAGLQLRCAHYLTLGDKFNLRINSSEYEDAVWEMDFDRLLIARPGFSKQRRGHRHKMRIPQGVLHVE